MKARINKKQGQMSGITISDIWSEGQLDMLLQYVEGTGCKVENKCMGGTKKKITGTTVQLNKFIDNWNN
jgi:hypothetical protein